MKKNSRELGELGETLALKALKEENYQIIARNISLGGGEIDIIAKDNDELVFVEVKTRAGNSFGTASEAISPQKARRIAKAALAYISSHHYHNIGSRCDLVAIDFSSKNTEPEIQIFRNIIDLNSAVKGSRWQT